VGASTGGTEALRVFRQDLPADAPGMVIVQHMPEKVHRRLRAAPRRACAGRR
jgi:two-component system, chemotaxis family, protein-glutamate methylesterase/glutaminase